MRLPCDETWMRRALALARKGARAAHPNPIVGCVLVKDGRNVGEGWHARFGGPHAEAEALRRAGKAARGATAYVTLEPCCAHPGKKTPPCAPALAAAGVARVVVAMKDPNPAVCGKGLALLKAAGVAVECGALEKRAESLNRDFIARMRRRRPRVILKAALSLDGRPFARGGASKWITGPAARAEVSRLRAQCDAILVGVGTVLADDPALTSRGAGRDPLRVVLDTRLRTPAGAKVLDGAAPTLIFTARRGRRPGAECERVPAAVGGLDLPAVLASLARRGVGSVLVEGGPSVHAAFLAAGLVDEVRVFLAPKLLSGTGDPNSAPTVSPLRLKKIGPDFLFYGPLRCSPASSRS